MIAALVLVPLLAGFALYAVPRSREALATGIGVAVSAAMFVLAALATGAPDETLIWLQRPFTANFHVGLGAGPSLWFVLLLTLVTACSLAVTRLPRQRDFVAQMLLLLGAMTGVFVSRDLLLFALFFDLQLIPTFLLLVGWSPDRSSNSAWRYLVYNLTGGLALLLGVAAFGIVQGSTDVIGSLAPDHVYLQGAVATWTFAGVAFAFAVKTPIWPLHTWMPPTYGDLPPPAAAVVSAVQSKAGLYGFLAILLPLFPNTMHAAQPLFFSLGLVSLLYGAFAALVQDDVKRIVAYSSLSHLGLIVLAIFSFNQIALGGAIVYAIAHGLFSAGLFLVAGSIEAREDTRSLERLGGLGGRSPRLAGGLVLVALAALGLPGLCGFAGEILILTGLYGAGFVWQAGLALIPIVLAAAYILRMYQGVMHGPPAADLPQREDLTPLEIVALAPIVAAIVLLGLNPGPVTRLPAPVSGSPLATSAVPATPKVAAR